MTLSQASLRSAWAPACGSTKRVRVPLHGAGSVVVRGALLHATQALSDCLRHYGYRTRYADTGGYVCRAKTGGGAYSTHAYGIAIDINWQSNPYSRRLITNMPRAMVAAIKGIRTNSGAQVWTWGGDWSGNKDAMHFEVGCSPRDIATGINWRTVPGGSYVAPLPYIPKPKPKPVAVVAPAPEPEPEEEDVAVFVHRKQTGHRMKIVGNDAIHLDAPAREAHERLALLGGKPIAWWEMSELDWSNFLYGVRDAFTGQPVVRKRG